MFKMILVTFLTIFSAIFGSSGEGRHLPNFKASLVSGLNELGRKVFFGATLGFVVIFSSIQTSRAVHELAAQSPRGPLFLAIGYGLLTVLSIYFGTVLFTKNVHTSPQKQPETGAAETDLDILIVKFSEGLIQELRSFQSKQNQF